MLSKDPIQSISDDELLSPLRAIRLSLNMTPEALANIANIQQAAIGQAEEGFYPNPLPAYLDAVGILPGTPDYKKLQDDYREYQKEKRILNGPNGNSKLVLNPRFSLVEHPLLTWRNQSGITTYGFCAAYCIHMPSVNHFEKQIMKITMNPPRSIVNPLIEAGFDDVLDEFTEACRLYKAHLLNSVRAHNNLPLTQVS